MISLELPNRPWRFLNLSTSGWTTFESWPSTEYWNVAKRLQWGSWFNWKWIINQVWWARNYYMILDNAICWTDIIINPEKSPVRCDILSLDLLLTILSRPHRRRPSVWSSVRSAGPRFSNKSDTFHHGYLKRVINGCRASMETATIPSRPAALAPVEHQSIKPALHYNLSKKRMNG